MIKFNTSVHHIYIYIYTFVHHQLHCFQQTQNLPCGHWVQQLLQIELGEINFFKKVENLYLVNVIICLFDC